MVIAIAGSGHLDRILSIIKEGSGIISMNVEKPDLEDVFLTLTGRTLRDGGEKQCESFKLFPLHF